MLVEEDLEEEEEGISVGQIDGAAVKWWQPSLTPQK